MQLFYPQCLKKVEMGISSCVRNAGKSFRIEATVLRNIVPQKAPLFYTFCGTKIQRTRTLKKNITDVVVRMVVALTVCSTLIHHFDYPVGAIISKMHTPTQSRGPKSSSITCPLVGQPTDLRSDVWTQQMSHVNSTSIWGRGARDSRPTGDRVCYLDRTSYRSALGSKAICFIGAIWRQT